MFPPPILPNADIGYGQQQDRPQESQDHALLLVAKCDASVSPSLDTSLSSLAWCDLDTEEHCAIVLDHSAVWVCAMLLPVRFSSCIWAGCLGTARLSPRTTSTAAGCRVFCHVTLHHYHCVAGAAQVSPRASRGHADIPHLLELPARNVSSQQWILPTTITAVSLRCDLQLSSLLPHLEKTGRKRCAPPHLSAYSIVSLHQHGLRDMYFIGLQLDTVAIYFVAPTAPAWPQGTIQVGPFFPRRVVLRSQDRGTVCARCCWGFISEARNWSSVAYAPARTHISV